MSFEVFVHCFTGGERDGIGLAEVRRAFGPYLQTGEQDRWRVAYDEQNTCDIHVELLPSDPRSVHFMSVQRPCADCRLWEALFSMLKIGHCVLYFPADRPPLLVADESMAEHLPRDMVESMGPITRVSSAQQILDEIKKA